MSKQLKNILAKIKADLKNVVENEVTDDVKDVYTEEVIRMYDEFTPKMYDRRYDQGGFADEDNWSVDVKQRGNDTSFELTNETKAINSRMRLDKIIEEGIYDYPNSPSERPVYERTMEQLEQERTVEKALKRGLEARGYNLE